MKPNPVMHFHVPVDDMSRAARFYEGVFGWQISRMPEMTQDVFRLAATVASDEGRHPTAPGAINGGLCLRSAQPEERAWIVIGVDSIVEHLKKIEAAGGRLLVEKMAVFDIGFYAEAVDTEGNAIGLFEEVK